METKMNGGKKVFSISSEVYAQVKEFIGMQPAERGMMIGRSRDGVIRYCEIDQHGHCSAAAYDPDIEHMNAVIKRWNKEEIEFAGFIHSHPGGIRNPSEHDHWYAGEILACFKKLELMWMPIVQTVPTSGKFELIPYAVIPGKQDRKGCEIVRCKLEIMGTLEPEESHAKPTGSEADSVTDKPLMDTSENENGGEGGEGKTRPEPLAENETPDCMDDPVFAKCTWFGIQSPLANQQGFADYCHASPDYASLPAKWIEAKTLHAAYFKRLQDHYDMDLLNRTRLIVVGTGGASLLVRNCARMGFGEFVLIDPDTITETNIGTQDALPSAIGMKKVDVLGNDVSQINPISSVAAFPVELNDFNDGAFESLIHKSMRWKLDSARMLRDRYCADEMLLADEPIVPLNTILMVLTDRFEAQSRGHRLGLHFGIPTICAQEYVEGIGAEVTYTVPGITPACHRCITASRYKAYLDEGFQNDVTSSGAPVFAAEFLNAVLGHVLLAIAHHETDHPRWGKVIRTLGNRNLLQIRMDHSFDQRLGIPAFGSRIAGVNDPNAFYALDTLFLRQTPDAGQSDSRPVCPDCGGTGNLLESVGRLGDTLAMRS